MLASIIKVNGYQPFKTMMLREYWENRRAIFMTPLLITGLFMLLITVSMGIFGEDIDFNGERLTIGEFIAQMSAFEAQKLQEYLNHMLLASNMPILIGAFLCMVFTALSSLYDERKDNSILFWKSMPVSDLQTVISKLLTVVLVIPLVALGFSFIFQVFLLIVGSLATIGTEHSAWDLLWSATNFPALILAELSAIIIYGLWALPVFAWLMLVSVAAKRTPLLLATIPIALTAVMEELFFNTNHLLEFIVRHLSINAGENSGLSDEIKQLSANTSLEMLKSVTEPGMWLGLGIASVMLYATVWLRKRNSL